MSDLRVHSVHVAAAGDGRAVTQSVTRGDLEDVQAFTTRVLAMLEGAGLPFAVDATDLVELEPQPSAPIAVAPVAEVLATPPTAAPFHRRYAKPRGDRAQQIVERLRGGASSISELAVEFGITDTNVRALWRRWCPEVPPPGFRPRRPHTATAAPGPSKALASATGNEPPASSPHPPAVTTPAAAVPQTPVAPRADRFGGGASKPAGRGEVCRSDACPDITLHRVGECQRRAAR